MADQNLSHTDSQHQTPDQASGGFRATSKKFLGVLWEFVKVIIVALIIVLPIRYYLFQPFVVNGESMSPNFATGDYLVVNEIAYRMGDPKRGDVVVLKYPPNPSQRFIKRVIGLPNETIDIKGGKVTIYRDQEVIVLNESSYLADTIYTEGNIHVSLKENEYFVMGDNRPYSYDSRRWGVLPREDIIGRAMLRLLPLNHISYIHGLAY